VGYTNFGTFEFANSIRRSASIIASATPSASVRHKTPHCRNNKVSKDWGYYSKWLIVADAMIKTRRSSSTHIVDEAFVFFLTIDRESTDRCFL